MRTSRTRINPFHLIVITALFATCGSEGRFMVTAAGQAMVPQRSTVSEPLGSVSLTGLEDFRIADGEEVTSRGYDADDIDSVRLVSLTLTVTAPLGRQFEFLDSIAISLTADDLPPVEIAKLESVPPNATMLELEVDSEVDLARYLTSDSLAIVTDAGGVRPPEEITVSSSAEFDVGIRTGLLSCN